MKLPSASQLSLASKCLYPWTPAAIWQQGPAGQAAERGTRIHAAVAKILDPSSPDVSGLSDEENAVANGAAAVIQQLCPIDAATTIPVEVALAYQPVTGEAKVLGSNIGRNYSGLSNSWLVGTADVLWVEGGVVHVLDIKTGSIGNVQSAAQNNQLAALALYAARAYGADSAVVHLAFADAHGVAIESATLDEFALDSVAGELAALVADVQRGDAKPQPGAHCRWCPARGACPEVVQVEGALVTGVKSSLPVVTEAAAIQGPDHAAYLLSMLRAVRDRADLVEAALKEYADKNDGIQMGDKRWQKREVTRESIELDDFGVAALRKVLGHHALDAFTMSATKSSIQKAAKAVAAEHGLKAKQVESEALDALRALGAIKTSQSTRYEEK